MEKQSALHRCHLEAQGRMQAFFGWQLPAWYQDPSSEMDEVLTSAGISDASYLWKLDARGPLTVDPPARQWKLTPAHSLVTSPLPIEYAPSSWLTEVTSLYSAILLAGPKSREVLHKLTTLNVSDAAMPQFTARQTRLAHVNAIILRGQGFFILNTRDVAEHVWEALQHAGARPFGMVAQQHWMGYAQA
jgi:glycine cleavage system aminomethyltransferase T